MSVKTRLEKCNVIFHTLGGILKSRNRPGACAFYEARCRDENLREINNKIQNYAVITQNNSTNSARLAFFTFTNNYES